MYNNIYYDKIPCKDILVLYLRYQVVRGGCCGLKISWMAILKALIPIILHMIFCALICLGDFGLWLILAVAKKHGAVEYNVEGTAKSTYEIKVCSPQL